MEEVERKTSDNGAIYTFNGGDGTDVNQCIFVGIKNQLIFCICGAVQDSIKRGRITQISDEMSTQEVEISAVKNSKSKLFEVEIEVEYTGNYQFEITLEDGLILTKNLFCIGELAIKKDNPFNQKTDKYGKISRIYYEILQFFIPNGISVLEAGSSTGHLSLELAKEERDISLIEIRPKAVRLGKKRFREAGVPAKFYLGNFLEHDIKYDFIWNTGLICSGFEDDLKEDFVKKASELSENLLVICGDNVRAYPELEIEKRRSERGSIPRGGDPDMPIGVGAAITYPGINVPAIFSKYYKKVYTGMISQSDGFPGSERFWTFGTNGEYE